MATSRILDDRQIVICCDGTNNKYGDHNTNVVKLFEQLGRQENDQITFYDPGVGTFDAFRGFAPGAVRKLVGRVAGLAFGYGIRQNMKDALYFLMNNHHHEKNEIFLFGFSRGAFTARLLAHYLAVMGVPQKGSGHLLDYAIDIYFDNRRGKVDDKTLEGFKAAFMKPAQVQCVGVWDTVGSLGWFLSKQMRNHPMMGKVKKQLSGRLHPGIRVGIHAMAIDEKRKKFPVTRWTKLDPEAVRQGQIVEEVWFAGVHADVGGWYDDAGLSDIALRWMMERAQARAGLRVPPGVIDSITGNIEGKLHKSRTGFWRVWPKAHRPVKAGDKVHQSVADRMQSSSADYDPVNLPAGVVYVDKTYRARGKPESLKKAG